MKRTATDDQSDGLTLPDLERFFCEPYGLRFIELAGFPPPTYPVTKSNPVPRWSGSDLVPWLVGFFRGVAPYAPEFGECIALEECGRPLAGPEELREYAITRIVDVRVAKVLMRRLP